MADFTSAMKALRSGFHMTRKAWKDTGVYIWYMPPAIVKAEWCKEPHLKRLAEENGGEIECLEAFRMLTEDKKVLTGWAPTQEDLEATEWTNYF
jgi:hypothetical protein